MKRRNLFLNGLAFLMCLFLFAGGLSAQTVKTATVPITSSGTWTVPTELNGSPITVTSVYFEAWGGGGAGGYAYSTGLLRPTAGGGGAAYAKSAKITDMTDGETFTITVGAGGTAIGDDPDHYTVENGGTTTVYRGETPLAIAVGGKSVTGYQNWENPGAGGNASECFGQVVYSGGHGGKADRGALKSGAYCISGSGGGAAGPNGNGGNAADSWGRNYVVWYKQVTGAPGSAGGGLAGSGAWGQESQIIGGAGWGNAEGNKGNNYGGGGGGAIGNNLPGYGDANGGAGGPGAVRVVYTYTTDVNLIDIEDATANTCSGAEFDIPLNITVNGFNLDQININIGIVGIDGLAISTPTASYNTTDGKWHLTGTITNSTSNAIACPIRVTVSHGTLSDEATVTVTVYGELAGGTIAENQLVCSGKDIQTLVSTADATGGSSSGSYQWWQYVIRDENNVDVASPAWEQIAVADAPDYTPEQKGLRKFKRVYVDACGTVESNVLEVATVDPFKFNENFSSKDTICSNQDYAKTLYFSISTPIGGYTDGFTWGVYWQKSVNGGAWENLNSTISHTGSYDVTLHPGDFADGDDIWYRAAVKINDCDSIISNAIYKLHVREVPKYDGQFPDINITLWYGACDTSIANLPAPELTPVPAEITRADEYTRVAPGEYTIKWRVKPNPDCDIYDTYDQKVIVKYPECGTVENPVSFTNPADLEEYQTIRIGCECWLAENLRTNAAGAVYYDEDEANKPFGKLYDWNAAVAVNNTEMTAKTGAKYIQGVCPEGWSIPSVGQYTTLMGEGLDALKSNEEGTWLPGKLGTNASGFNMKGAGLYEAGQFKRMLGYADFWTSGTVEGNSTVATAVEARYDCDEMMPKNMNKENKISVRCVRIEPAE